MKEVGGYSSINKTSISQKIDNNKKTTLLIFIFTLLGLIMGLFLAKLNDSTGYSWGKSCEQSLVSCREDYSVRLRKDKALQQQIDELRDKTKYQSSSKRCNKTADIWEYLPDELKKKTFKEGIISPGESTYDITPLNWSKDCNKLPFVLELLGRDAAAYKESDYVPRGVYLFIDSDKKIDTVLQISKTIFVDNSIYESNFWFQGKYIFVTSTSENESIITKRRYEYDSKTKRISPFLN